MQVYGQEDKFMARNSVRCMARGRMVRNTVHGKETRCIVKKDYRCAGKTTVRNTGA